MDKIAKAVESPTWRVGRNTDMAGFVALFALRPRRPLVPTQEIFTVAGCESCRLALRRRLAFALPNVRADCVSLT
jgi:hypothetical protein